MKYDGVNNGGGDNGLAYNIKLRIEQMHNKFKWKCLKK